MPRTCTICSNKQRKKIDAEVGSGLGYRTIASHFEVSLSALKRHAASCIPECLEEARKAGRIESGVAVANQLRELVRSTDEILTRRLKSHTLDDDDCALKAIARREKQIELQARLEGKFQRAAENETDRARKVRQYEAAINSYLEQSESAGLLRTREQAIDDLARYEPDIVEYVH